MNTKHSEILKELHIEKKKEEGLGNMYYFLYNFILVC